MKIISVIAIIVTLIFSVMILLSADAIFAFEQPEVKFNSKTVTGSDDTVKTKTAKSKTQKINFGGLFLSPGIGMTFPLGTFSNYSNSGFTYSFKAEIAYNKFYPFVFGFVYENQTNQGNPEFTSSKILSKYETKIISYGGSIDVILNKYFKSNFTSPVLTFELKYASVNKTVEPPTMDPEIPGEENLLTYSAGLGFTIYVLDIVSKYTFAGDYSNINIQARIHIPVVKF